MVGGGNREGIERAAAVTVVRMRMRVRVGCGQEAGTSSGHDGGRRAVQESAFICRRSRNEKSDRLVNKRQAQTQRRAAC